VRVNVQAFVEPAFVPNHEREPTHYSRVELAGVVGWVDGRVLEAEAEDEADREADSEVGAVVAPHIALLPQEATQALH
jgi:hypothetical protein